LTGLAAKLRSADAEERQRLLELQTDLCRSISGSAKRLKQIVGRIQRFTNLEGAEIQPADLNQLLNDTAALLQPKIRDNIELELRLEPLPPVLCRPEQMSAVFSSLLSNAIRAVSGAGRIEVSTVRAQDQVRVQIRDNGRGMTPEELAAVFYPGFKVQAGRVATGNWSLFSSRQIIHEHGGEIRIESVEGRGTSVNVLLPFQSARVEVLSA
jgi:signal transduction histidine kinase